MSHFPAVSSFVRVENLMKAQKLRVNSRWSELSRVDALKTRLLQRP
jgi:hypothetical protein